MASTMLRNGIRMIPRLRINQPACRINTLGPLRQRQEDYGGRTFARAIRDNTPKTEGKVMYPQGTRSAIGFGVLCVIGGVVLYTSSKKDVKAKSLAESDEKKLPIYRKDEVAKHKTKETQIWE